MKRLIGFVVCALLWQPAGNAQGAMETYVVQRPTILAFFPPVTGAELEKDPDTNEALGDFQLYAMRAGPKLKKAGIDFEVISATKFKIKDGKVVRTLSSGKVGIGYYFIMPGKKPLVRYGVMTDDEIVEVTGKYFRIGSQSATSSTHVPPC